jgi:RimJ/RimL family protein N-acetyltransferase
MLQGKRVRLRSIGRDDLPRQLAFNNSLEIELAGGGDPPMPQSLERLQADFDSAAGKGGRDDPSFGIEADGQFIGQCALFNTDAVARSCELGITNVTMGLLREDWRRPAPHLLGAPAKT